MDNIALFQYPPGQELEPSGADLSNVEAVIKQEYEKGNYGNILRALIELLDYRQSTREDFFVVMYDVVVDAIEQENVKFFEGMGAYWPARLTAMTEDFVVLAFLENSVGDFIRYIRYTGAPVTMEMINNALNDMEERHTLNDDGEPYTNLSNNLRYVIDSYNLAPDAQLMNTLALHGYTDLFAYLSGRGERMDPRYVVDALEYNPNFRDILINQGYNVPARIPAPAVAPIQTPLSPVQVRTPLSPIQTPLSPVQTPLSPVVTPAPVPVVTPPLSPVAAQVSTTTLSSGNKILTYQEALEIVNISGNNPRVRQILTSRGYNLPAFVPAITPAPVSVVTPAPVSVVAPPTSVIAPVGPVGPIIPPSFVPSVSIPPVAAVSGPSTVTNPKTGRTIQVGGGVYKQLIKEGYVNINGQMIKRS